MKYAVTVEYKLERVVTVHARTGKDPVPHNKRSPMEHEHDT